MSFNVSNGQKGKHKHKLTTHHKPHCYFGFWKQILYNKLSNIAPLQNYTLGRGRIYEPQAGPNLFVFRAVASPMGKCRFPHAQRTVLALNNKKNHCFSVSLARLVPDLTVAFETNCRGISKPLICFKTHPSGSDSGAG